MSRRILGLDIRQDGITAVMVVTGIKGPWVDDYVHISIPDPEEPEMDIAAALARMAQQMDVPGSTCVVSLPVDHVSFRNIQVPFREKKKIRQVLPFELEPALPRPVDSLVIDFQSSQSSDQAGLTHVVTAGIEAATLDSYTATLASQSIRPKSITIGSCTLAACIDRFADTPENWLLVDAGDRETTVVGMSSGQICFARALPGLSGESGTSASIGRGIRQVLTGFEDLAHLVFQPQLLMVTGSGRGKTGLAQELSESLDLPVEETDLLRHAQMLPRGLHTDLEEALDTDHALALALSEAEGIGSLNFRTGPFAEESFWIEHKKSLLRTGILAAMVLVSVISYYLIDAYYVQRRIERLDQQLTGIFAATFPRASKIVDPVLQMRGKLKEIKQRALIASNPGESPRAIDILNQISSGIPVETDVRLTRLDIGDGNVRLTGDTDTYNSVDGMKSRLAQETAFKNVIITSSKMNKSGNRVDFKLKAEF